MCRQTYRQICEIFTSVLVLYCLVFLYLMAIKIVNNTNKDRRMPYLRQSMERQARSKVLTH